MKFYVIENEFGETVGCETTLHAAKNAAHERGLERDEYEITVVDCAVNAETVRRLLGNLGGYARS